MALDARGNLKKAQPHTYAVGRCMKDRIKPGNFMDAVVYFILRQKAAG